MSPREVCLAVWLGVAAIIAVGTWIEGVGTFYVYDRPPAILRGLTWPLWLPVWAVFLALEYRKDRP